MDVMGGFLFGLGFFLAMALVVAVVAVIVLMIFFASYLRSRAKKPSGGRRSEVSRR